MKLNEFRSLSEYQQFEVVEQNGVFLAEREDGYYNVRLFAVGNFYAELFCHSHFNVIVRTKAFLSTKRLEPYLQQININPLLDL